MIQNLEAGADGRVAALKLQDGSTIEADTVTLLLTCPPDIWNPFFMLHHPSIL